MSLAVLETKAYVCPLCKSVNIDNAAAKKCLRKCSAKERTKQRDEKNKAKAEVLANYVRFNATSFEHAWELAIKQAKEEMDIVLTLDKNTMTFGKVSNTHDCPIGGVENFTSKRDMPTHYLGWSGRIEGTAKTLNGKGSYSGKEVTYKSIFRSWTSMHDSDYTAGFLIKGFHSGTGNYGG